MSLGKLRAALAALLVGGLAAGVLWVYAAEPPRELSAAPRAEAAPFPSESEPAAVPASTTPAPVSATPTPTPAPTEPPPTLEDLRASDAYIEFAETRRARSAPGVDRAYNGFGWDGGDGNYYEFVNASTLWNEISGPVRDQLLDLGIEYKGELLDGEIPAPYVVSFRRHADEDTQTIALIGASETNHGIRVHIAAVSIALNTVKGQLGYGVLIDRMQPFTLNPQRYKTWSELSGEGIEPPITSWRGL